MIRHSPAPFILEYICFEDQHGNEIPSFRIYDADGDVVAETDSGKPADQQESDAYLLAAAPELLEALEELMETWQCNPDHYAEEIDKYRPLISNARGHR